MKTLIGMIATAIIIWLLILREDSRAARINVGLAEDFEKQGAYEKAIYHYAIAGWKSLRKKLCRDRLVALYREHGPFDFEGIRKEYHDDRHPDRSENLHAITVKYIRDSMPDLMEKR